MRKAKEDQWKRRPYCGKTENQIKAGYNGSASQRMVDAAPAPGRQHLSSQQNGEEGIRIKGSAEAAFL